MKDHLMICSATVIILLAVMPSILASAVGCTLACKKCRQRNEHPSIVTVYCEMCEECKLKRDKRLRSGNNMDNLSYQGYQDVIEVEDLADCPQAPECSAEEQQETPTTTTTTTKKPCPPPPRCVLKPRTPPPLPPMMPPPCMGCLPMCPMMMPMCMPPGQNPFATAQVSSDSPVSKTTAKAAEKDKGKEDYISVFVGIPKDLELNGAEDDV